VVAIVPNIPCRQSRHRLHRLPVARNTLRIGSFLLGTTAIAHIDGNQAGTTLR